MVKRSGKLCAGKGKEGTGKVQPGQKEKQGSLLHLEEGRTQVLRFSPAKRKTRASKFWGRPDCSGYKRAIFLAVTSNREPGVFLGGASSGPNGGRSGSANISEVTVVEKSSVTEQKVELRPAGLLGLLMSPLPHFTAYMQIQPCINGINDSSVLLSYLFILLTSSDLDHHSFLDETEQVAF